MFSVADNKCLYAIKNILDNMICKGPTCTYIDYININFCILSVVIVHLSSPSHFSFLSMSYHIHLTVLLMCLISFQMRFDKRFSFKWRDKRILRRIDSNVIFIKKTLGRNVNDYPEFEWGAFFSEEEKLFSPPPRWRHTLRHLRGRRKRILKRIDSNVKSIKKTLGETDGNHHRVFLLLQELKK